VSDRHGARCPNETNRCQKVVGVELRAVDIDDDRCFTVYRAREIRRCNDLGCDAMLVQGLLPALRELRSLRVRER